VQNQLGWPVSQLGSFNQGSGFASFLDRGSLSDNERRVFSAASELSLSLSPRSSPTAARSLLALATTQRLRLASIAMGGTSSSDGHALRLPPIRLTSQRLALSFPLHNRRHQLGRRRGSLPSPQRRYEPCAKGGDAAVTQRNRCSVIAPDYLQRGQGSGDGESGRAESGGAVGRERRRKNARSTACVLSPPSAAPAVSSLPRLPDKATVPARSASSLPNRRPARRIPYPQTSPAPAP
jgi:hypothetical protein